MRDKKTSSCVLTVPGPGAESESGVRLRRRGIIEPLPELLSQDVPALSAETLAGKTISILGDSISTFSGISNGTAADTTNSTIRDGKVFYSKGTYGMTADDTWWMQTANELGLRLLVNNSWAGSCFLQSRAGAVGAWVDRCVQIHDDTGENAGEEPDLIVIHLGTNDFTYDKSRLGSADIDYDALFAPDGERVYREYAANGYLIAPEGATAVNIPMADDSDGWELYLLDREHRETESATAPSCTELGFVEAVCSICQSRRTLEELPALGHAWSEPAWFWAEDHGKASASFQCTRCGETVTLEAVIAEETDESGSTLTASVMFEGQEYTSAVFIAAPVLYGDVNDDGAIDGRDAVRLAQYLARWEVTVNQKTADTDGDGLLTGKDLIRLVQYLAHWEITLG